MMETLTGAENGQTARPQPLEPIRSPENIEVIPQERVSVLAVGIHDLNELVSTGVTPWNRRFLTYAIVEQKAPDSTHPYDIVLPGGNIPDSKPAPITKKSMHERISRTAQATLSHELHVSTMTDDTIIPLSTRWYRHLHPGSKQMPEPSIREQWETIVQAEMPPFLENGMQSYYPTHKVGNIYHLSPDSFQSLMTDEFLPGVITGNGDEPLIDSLCTSSQHYKRRQDRLVETDGQEDEVKSTLIQQVYAFEAGVRMEVVNTLLSISQHPQLYALEVKWNEIAGKYNRSEQSISDTTALFIQYQEFLDIFKNQHESLSAEQQEWAGALRRVTFEHNLDFIQNAGPQTSYLFAQMMLGYEDVSDFEYEKMAEMPEVHAVYDILCETFDVNREGNPSWYREAVAALLQYRDMKRVVTMNPFDENVTRLENIQKKLNSLFSTRYGLPEEQITRMFAEVYGYEEYLGQPIQRIADAQLRAQLLSSTKDAGIVSLDELLFGMVGIDHYGNRMTADQRWKYWRTWLSLGKMYQVENIRDKMLKRPLDSDPFDTVFNEFAGLPREQIALQDESFDVHQLFLPDSFQVEVAGSQITLGGLPLDIFSRKHIKSLYSVYRKIQEREKIANNGTVDIDDFYGRQIVLDTETFWQAFCEKYPQHCWAKDDVFAYLIPTMAEAIVNIYQQYMTTWQYTYERDKVRQSGVFNGIVTSGRENGAGIAGGTGGSAVSHITWDMAKYAHRVSAGLHAWKEEVQIFASRESLEEKEQDQKLVFALQRMFEVHESGRAPVMYSWFGMNRSYPDVMRNFGTNGVFQPELAKAGIVASAI